MIQTLTCLSITCNLQSAGNTNGRKREIAILIRDGALVWCAHCQLSHYLHKDDCLKVWDAKRGIESLRKTCDEPSHRNKEGRNRLYVKVDSIGIACWCKYCQKTHYITKEQCLEMWG